MAETRDGHCGPRVNCLSGPLGSVVRSLGAQYIERQKNRRYTGESLTKIWQVYEMGASLLCEIVSETHVAEDTIAT